MNDSYMNCSNHIGQVIHVNPSHIPPVAKDTKKPRQDMCFMPGGAS